MRKAIVYMYDEKAGMLYENEEGYFFEYLPSYLASNHPVPISLTLPLQKTTFHSKWLFPFFDGLIPEGWVLDGVTDYWKLEKKDRMGLLLATGKSCVGAVSIHQENKAQS